MLMTGAIPENTGQAPKRRGGGIIRGASRFAFAGRRVFLPTPDRSMYLVLLYAPRKKNPTGYGIAVNNFGGVEQLEAVVIEDGHATVRCLKPGEFSAKLKITPGNLELTNHYLKQIKLVVVAGEGCYSTKGQVVEPGTIGVAVNAHEKKAGFLEVFVCWDDRYTSATPASFFHKAWTDRIAPPPARAHGPVVAREVSHVDVRTQTSILIECPGCQTKLRVKQVGAKALVRCPDCKAAFFAVPSSGKLEISFSDTVVRRREDGRPAHEQLGVDPDASLEDAKRAWRRHIKLYHPDNFHHLGEEFVALANQRTRQLNSAYAKLTE